MKKYVILVSALACAAATTPSMARVTHESVDQRGPIATYCVEYVPAEVEVNTRGKLVRAKSAPYWDSSTLAEGAIWNRVQDPAVFMTTRHTVVPDHYTLVPDHC